MIDFICRKHKDKGIQCSDWSHFKNSKIGCPYCYGRYKTTKNFINELQNEDIEILTEYYGCEKPIDCKCKICGNIWTTLPKVLISNKSGCPKCGKIKASLSRRISQEDFVRRLSNVNSFIEIIGEYTGAHKKILCRCKKCNNVWEGYPANLLNGSAGCPKCNLSDGERKLLMLLDKFNINYISQYSLKDCKNVLPLKFDAFDIDNNIAYEYNGEQHYKTVMLKNHFITDEELHIIKQRDEIKQTYCKNNNIPLIIIPYWEKNNMENFLLSEFTRKELYC